jgi:hypothetical protein
VLTGSGRRPAGCGASPRRSATGIASSNSRIPGFQPGDTGAAPVAIISFRPVRQPGPGAGIAARRTWRRTILCRTASIAAMHRTFNPVSTGRHRGGPPLLSRQRSTLPPAGVTMNPCPPPATRLHPRPVPAPRPDDRESTAGSSSPSPPPS